MGVLRPGDLVFIWSPEKADSFLIQLEEGSRQDTRLGVVRHDDILGKSLGESVKTHLGREFCLLSPTIHEFSRRVKRKTQIMFPKDTGFILLALNIGQGSRVIECGTGSGSLTSVLAHFVGEDGKVISYDRRPEFSKLAERNCRKWGVAERVEFKVRDIGEGFEEEEVDALFLDVPNPWDYLGHAWRALSGGHRIGILVPTTNQVAQVLDGLEEWGFADLQVMEILLRPYKTNSRRLRPEDTMIGHTGFLLFGAKTQGKKTAEAAGETDEKGRK
ncbi:MAG: tRNA (adenine-N1)-methyltransferase [Thermovirgaceae bacterium]